MRSLLFSTIFFFCAPAFADKLIIVDLRNFKWMAYEDDTLVKDGIAAGGRRWCPDTKRPCKTPHGEFLVLKKYGKYYRSPLYPLNCGGESKIKCAPMPYSVKFKHSGESIHGSSDHWENPKHISHGCVHVSKENAKWINEFTEVNKTKIVILRY